MKILVLVYEGFAEFEMTLLGYLARETGHGVATAAPDDTPEVTGLAGLRVKADLPLSLVDPDDYAALIVPGGNWRSLIDRERVHDLIRRFQERGKVIGGICAGTAQLAKAGILAGRPFTNSFKTTRLDVFDEALKTDAAVVIDGNIITAKGEAFRKFAYTVLEELGVDLSDAEAWRRDLE